MVNSNQLLAFARTLKSNCSSYDDFFARRGYFLFFLDSLKQQVDDAKLTRQISWCHNKVFEPDPQYYECVVPCNLEMAQYWTEKANIIDLDFNYVEVTDHDIVRRKSYIEKVARSYIEEARRLFVVRDSFREFLQRVSEIDWHYASKAASWILDAEPRWNRVAPINDDLAMKLAKASLYYFIPFDSIIPEDQDNEEKEFVADSEEDEVIEIPYEKKIANYFSYIKENILRIVSVIQIGVPRFKQDEVKTSLETLASLFNLGSDLLLARGLAFCISKHGLKLEDAYRRFDPNGGKVKLNKIIDLLKDKGIIELSESGTYVLTHSARERLIEDE